MSFSPCEGVQRLVRIESTDCEALGRVELALKAYLVERGAELVSEFGIGYIRIDPSEAETEMDRPRG